MRVLYVDDDRVNTLLFVEACRVGTTGIEVETAATGAEALEIAAQWRPELLVVDLHLPDTDGYALLPRLRALLSAPALPAYLCTADEALFVEPRAREAGYDGCWTKPVQLRPLLDEITRHARR